MLSYVTAARAVGTTYILAFALWFTLEGSAASKYIPQYSWSTNMISDLGVPYMYYTNTTLVIYSPLSWLMNLNFFVTACLYAFPHWLLLYATQGQGRVDQRLRTGRGVVSFLYMAGMIMVGSIHGGPHEHESGAVFEHQIGATMAILGGNLCSILAGLSPAQIEPFKTGPFYRIASVTLGVIGIASVIALVTITPEAQAGTVERLSCYTIFTWQLFTGIFLLLAPNNIGAKVKSR